MIHYQLQCSAEHGFDGWFKDSAGFDRQAQAGLVVCPECGDTAVHRALMAPSLKRKRATVDPSGAPAARPDDAKSPVAEKAAAAMPDQMRALLQKMRAEVERNCENVGDRFAEEALAIHKGESEARGIYGESTPEQAEALADEGVQIARIPWIPRADS